MPAKQGDLEDVKLLCTRFSTSTGHYEIVGFIELDAELVKTGEEMFFKRSSFRTVRPGNIYIIQMNKARTSIIKNARWCVDEYPNRDEVLQLQLAAKAWEEDKRADALEKRMGTSTFELEKRLKPVRDQYWALPAAQRVSFEVWLLKYLRGV